ncbi:MAG: hypothetical protein H0U74_11400 [Bradymonadaceae bacterium]|nr:hypothetical protein [Lujinxingiaceae bacterium]
MKDCIEHGNLVMHETLGLGKVVESTDDRLYVIFRDHGDRKAKRFAQSYQGLVLSEVQSDSLLDCLPPVVQEGNNWALPRQRLTADGAVARFLGRWPGGFIDASYHASERAGKLAIHTLFAEQLGDGKLASLLDEDQLAEAVARTKLVLKEVVRLKLASSLETNALAEALESGKPARAYLKALDKLLASDDDSALEANYLAYIKAFSTLPQVGKGRVFTWSNASLLPSLAKPATHMFMKSDVTKKAGETMGFDLKYDATPNWTTYAALLKMGRVWGEAVAALSPADLIDVQAFIHVTCGGYDKE